MSNQGANAWMIAHICASMSKLQKTLSAINSNLEKIKWAIEEIEND